MLDSILTSGPSSFSFHLIEAFEFYEGFLLEIPTKIVDGRAREALVGEMWKLSLDPFDEQVLMGRLQGTTCGRGSPQRNGCLVPVRGLREQR